MKKLLFVLVFSALGIVSYAAIGKINAPIKKTVKVTNIKKPYPVTATLSCGPTVTFSSSCTGTVAECIPYWNAAIEALESVLCGSPQ